MNYLKSLTLSLLLLLVGITTAAQGRLISGQVLDASDQPVPGVAILVQGTSAGSITGEQGKFSFRISDQQVTLVFSCLGYVEKKVPVPVGQTSVTVILEEDDMLLDETVVVGYGTQKKVNLTGAITTVAPESLQKRASHSVVGMLQGAVPGLNVTTSSGVPGSNPRMNIRGITSINNGTANPLVIVDGAVGDLSRINPTDVESISVVKDAAAAAVYGARAAFGVILVTTKTGNADGGNATVRFSGRYGWEEPTTSTDYETRGFWSAYVHNTFWQEESGTDYLKYTHEDMLQLLARVNDKSENPDRPWVVEDFRNGRKQWVYYGNYDWYNHLYTQRHPVQQYNLSISGGQKKYKYYLSGAFDKTQGMIRQNPDIFRKYNLRAKFEFDVNDWMHVSNNTSFYSSSYDFVGVDNVDNAIVYSSSHALPVFPFKNPDGSNLYSNPYINYKVANGRHIVFEEGTNKNYHRNSDFSNTTEIVIQPFRTFWLTANFTYRLNQDRNSHRKTTFDYREYPDGPMMIYNTGAGEDMLSENVYTRNYLSTNVFATYDETYGGNHHLSAVVGMNYETRHDKNLRGVGKNLLSKHHNDMDLVVPNEEGQVISQVGGGQSEYALMGVFARLNYDFKRRYLLEFSGRYDGTSRFAKGHRWGLFPSMSAGWRISEEPFFESIRNTVNNLKLRFSIGSLGNQNVSNYAYMRTISIEDLKYYTFGDSSGYSKYASISSPNSSDLSWETSQQYNLGLDMAFFNNRLNLTVEGYIRDTKDMLTAGIALPGVYGASSPKMNSADLRTSGYEIATSWRDSFNLAGQPFNYNIGFTLSDYRSYITKFDNPEKSFAKKYWKGMRFGDIWGYEIEKLFETDEEALEYVSQVNCGMINNHMGKGWRAGFPKYVDRNGNGVLDKGKDTVDDPGDRKVLGNSLPSLQYGITLGFDWMGFDVSTFFQGVGNNYWYPGHENGPFWGPYGTPYTSFLPRDFMDNVWSVDNKNAYFPAPLAYAARSNSIVGLTNDRYLQNRRYLRFKNLTVGYTLPERLTGKIGIDQVRFYFSGENLHYWSPMKKHARYIDPEEAFNASKATYDRFHYPWQKTMIFGIDVTF